MPFLEVVFQFKGGAKMKLQVENLIACLSLTVVTDGVFAPEISGGPTIILFAIMLFHL
jgi:hypothetical protein